MTDARNDEPARHLAEELREDELVFRRIHRAAPGLLFDAMTRPEHLTHFWGPEGTTTPQDRIVVDLRPGGAFETPMVSDNGLHEHVMRAVFTAVERPTRLAWREPESGMLTTITFRDLGDGRTEVITHQTHVPAFIRSAPAQAGFKTSLDRFERYIAALAGRGHEPPSSTR